MSTPPLNPISLRYPFELKDQPPEVVQAHRYAFQGIVDLNQAIAALKSQVDAKTTNVVTTIRTAGGGGGGAGPPGPPGPPGPGSLPGFGGVNDQTGSTAYTTLMNDNGIFLIFSDASPVAVTLNSALTTPYIFFATNKGTGTVTLTPTTGLVNGAASFVMPPSGLFLVAFDGTNWKTSNITQLILLQTNTVNNASQTKLNLVSGTNITITDLGSGNVQISASTSTVSAYVPRAKTANYTAIANDVIFCDTSAGGFTITLPASASNSGSAILVKKISSDSNNLTIARTGSDTIDGATSQVTNLPFSSYFFVADGVTSWGIF